MPADTGEIVIRPGELRDLPAVAAIQQASAEASQWAPADYLGFEFQVAEKKGELAGFVVTRGVAPGELEVLNLAVDPRFRRRGVGRTLLRARCAAFAGDVFLEVRESNAAARSFYKSLGFQEVGVRQGYYESAAGRPESAIVMKFHSC